MEWARIERVLQAEITTWAKAHRRRAWKSWGTKIYSVWKVLNISHHQHFQSDKFCPTMPAHASWKKLKAGLSHVAGILACYFFVCPGCFIGLPGRFPGAASWYVASPITSLSLHNSHRETDKSFTNRVNRATKYKTYSERITQIWSIRTQSL